MSLNAVLALTDAAVKPVVPTVGMGATYFVGTDRYPYHVKEVISAKEVVLQGAHGRRTDNNGQSESQQYEITPNPEGETVTVTLRKNGRWIKKGEPLGRSCYLLGEAQKYLDPSF